jgi:hypothetical protein
VRYRAKSSREAAVRFIRVATAHNFTALRVNGEAAEPVYGDIGR